MPTLLLLPVVHDDAALGCGSAPEEHPADFRIPFTWDLACEGEISLCHADRWVVVGIEVSTRNNRKGNFGCIRQFVNVDAASGITNHLAILDAKWLFGC